VKDRVACVVAVVLVVACFMCGGVSANDVPRVVHVYVALCDNEHQGIEPVPKALGDGEDLERNLYWGAMYGVKTFFSRSAMWSLVATVEKPSDAVLERVVFRHPLGVYLVADAYKGSEIKRASVGFLDAASGKAKETITVRVGEREVSFEAGGAADLVAYVGHNGLMDFDLPEEDGGKTEKDDGDTTNDSSGGTAGTSGSDHGESDARGDDTARADGATDAADEASTDAAASGDGVPGDAAASRDAAVSRDAVVLCCMSESYFAKRLEKAGMRPLLTTTGLMAPEAYTLKAALDGWIANESAEQIRVRAARAYDEYQDCNLGAAKRLFGVIGRDE